MRGSQKWWKERRYLAVPPQSSLPSSASIVCCRCFPLFSSPLCCCVRRVVTAGAMATAPFPPALASTAVHRRSLGKRCNSRSHHTHTPATQTDQLTCIITHPLTLWLVHGRSSTDSTRRRLRSSAVVDAAVDHCGDRAHTATHTASSLTVAVSALCFHSRTISPPSSVPPLVLRLFNRHAASLVCHPFARRKSRHDIIHITQVYQAQAGSK